MRIMIILYTASDCAPSDISDVSCSIYQWSGILPAMSGLVYSKGNTCPYCKGKLPVVGVNDFATLCSGVAKEWHPSKNGERFFENFLPNSHEEA